MMTLDECWKKYELMAIPDDAGSVQRREMRRAFYAGAYSLISLMLDATDTAGDDEDRGAEMIAAYEKECRDFAEAARTGKA